MFLTLGSRRSNPLDRSKESSSTVPGGRQGHGHRHRPMGQLSDGIASIASGKLDVRFSLKDMMGSIGVSRSKEKSEITMIRVSVKVHGL